MELKIEIRTVPGNALWTAGKLKPFILGFQKVKNKVWANKADDRIYWVVDADGRTYTKVVRNLAIFEKLVNGVLGNRLVRGAAKISPADVVILKDMLHNQTSVRVVKRDESYDLAEFESQESLSGQS